MQHLILQALNARDEQNLKELSMHKGAKDLLRYEEKKNYLFLNGKRSFTISDVEWFLKLYVFNKGKSIPGGKVAIFNTIKKMIGQKKVKKNKLGEYQLIPQ